MLLGPAEIVVLVAVVLVFVVWVFVGPQRLPEGIRDRRSAWRPAPRPFGSTVGSAPPRWGAAPEGSA